MAKTTGFRGLWTGCLLLVAGVGAAGAAPPTVAQMLEIYKPTFPDIPFTTPGASLRLSGETSAATAVLLKRATAANVPITAPRHAR